MTRPADRLPEFAIIGAVKGATTWVAHQLRSQPGIFLPQQEPHYFSTAFDRGIDWYANLFREAPAGARIGEKSADYLAHPWAAARLAALLPEGDWHFPEDEVSDASERILAAEITREQIYRQLHAELPYDSAVETEKFTTRRDGSVEIHQQILIARDSQKAIVLGKGGAKIRAIGSAAREEIAQQLGRKCHLFLHVKVKPDWDEDRSVYRDMGLDWVE